MPTGRLSSWVYQAILVGLPVSAIAFGFVSSAPPEASNAAALDLSVHPIAPAVEPTQELRGVNPSVERITTWISSVGAGAAVGDLDGDGLADDACLVDPRSDSVSIFQVTTAPRPRTAPKAVLVDRDDGIAPADGAAALPYDAERQAPMGCGLADVTADGWTDVLVYFWGRAPVMFLNQEDWSFEPHELVGPEGVTHDWYTNTALFSDLNGDGYIDIFVGNYFAEGSELLDQRSDTGVAMNDSLSRALNGGHNYVLLQHPGFPATPFELVDDAFTEKYSRGWTLAAATADFNGDQLPELYVANDFGPDRFFVNESTDGNLELSPVEGGHKGLLHPRSTKLGRDSFKSMGVTIADVDNDGAYDIYVSTITSPFGLFESQLLFLNDGDTAKGGTPHFRPGGEELGVARTAFSWDNKVADLDNDGEVELMQATGFVRGEVERWPQVQELALANDALVADPGSWPDLTDGDISGDAPRVVLKRVDDGRFANVASESGLDDAGVMRGIALADVDGDGDLDWIEANQWADARLVVNECADCGNFVGLRILNSTAPDLDQVEVVDGLQPQQEMGGFAAIGASATVTTAGGVESRSYVDGGNGHGGQSSSDMHVGIGTDAGTKHRVTITWRDSTGTTRSTDLEVGSGWNTVLLPWQA